MNFNNLYLVLAQGEPVSETAVNPYALIYHSNVLNFILVIVFLVWIARKTHIFSAITEKQNAINKKLTNAENEKKRAELELNDTKKLVANLDQEEKKIIKEAKEIASSLSDRINIETNIESEEIHKKAQKIIETEKIMASSEVMQDVSRAAFIIAEEHIKQAIDDRLHKKYIDEFIDDLDNLKV